MLYATSEMAPLIKTGGLADVAGGLPAALDELGCDVRVVLPYYGDLAGRVDVRVLQTTQLHGFTLEILETIAPQGQRVWLVACPEMFGRAGNPYVGPDGRDWPDNAERFALFAAAIAWLGTASVDPQFRADIVHLNDWHTALGSGAVGSRPESAGQRVQHPQPQLSGNLRLRHVRAGRIAG